MTHAGFEPIIIAVKGLCPKPIRRMGHKALTVGLEPTTF